MFALTANRGADICLHSWPLNFQLYDYCLVVIGTMHEKRSNGRSLNCTRVESKPKTIGLEASSAGSARASCRKWFADVERHSAKP